MNNESIKIADISDIDLLANLANDLWKNNKLVDLINEFTELISDNEAFIVLKYIDSLPIGFAQCQIRNDYVEGTETTPVGYLEGIFIKPNFRKCGYAKQLLRECENWAMQKGCKEFASDCEIDNFTSFKFHLASGFNETNRIICFTKKLN